jgi:hypothetical protein
VVSYTIVLAALIVVFTVLLFTRTDVEATVLRQRGTTFTVTEDDQIVNIFEMDITNKTHYNFRIFLKTNENDVTLKTASPKLLIRSCGH